MVIQYSTIPFSDIFPGNKTKFSNEVTQGLYPGTCMDSEWL